MSHRKLMTEISIKQGVNDGWNWLAIMPNVRQQPKSGLGRHNVDVLDHIQLDTPRRTPLNER
jgi:hypothetical protein